MMEKEKIILYVDDDAEDREFLSFVLSKAHPGIQLEFAENGLQALEYLQAVRQSRPPCLIVLDLNMPFLNGQETFKRIKTDDVLNAVPVIIFSSSERPDDKKCFTELGIEYFSKPDHIEQLQQIANHMVSVCCPG